jgi:xylulose-5-phosphate/fructose-6-phosphate phosphoketolase
MPDFRDYAVKVPSPGSVTAADTHELGVFLRDVAKANQEQRNFRIFGPDETLQPLERRVRGDQPTVGRPHRDNDEFLAPEGRVMEMLSEHQCEGWLEGYLLTGRHGLFNCYEAFIHIIDSMFNQHAKWLKVTLGLPWRRKIASLNYLLASHVWQQDAQRLYPSGPGLHRPCGEQEGLHRARLSAAGRQLSAVGLGPLPAQPPLRQRGDRRQVSGAAVVDMDAAVKHCSAGVGIWRWASNDEGNDQDAAPDVVMACCGDVPTLETLAAVSILRRAPARAEDPRGQRRRPHEAATAKRAPPRLERRRFRRAVHDDKPVIFAFHGYPWLIHRLTYRRTNHANFHVRGYKEEGTITTPFDMRVLNDLDRFHLVRACLGPGRKARAG